MANWDVFHSDRLEVARSLGTEAVREGLARGEIREDDLIRPASSGAPWTRIGDMPALFEPEPEPAPSAKQAPPARDDRDRDRDRPPEFLDDDDDDDAILLDVAEGSAPVLPISPFDEAEHRTIPASPKAPPPGTGKADRGGAGEPYGEFDLNLRGGAAAGATAGGGAAEASSIEVESWDDGLDIVDDGEGHGHGPGHGNGDGDGDGLGDEEEYDPLEEDEAVAEFTLSRGSAGKVEELDLAAMVDVAFQLVLFFLVTATTVLYKTLEVPKPNPESSATAPAAQGRSKTLDDLKDDFILVEIDPAGAVKIDHDPVPAVMNVLVERLRTERERTRRKAMLLSADFSTPHRSAVLAYDAANEIGMGIAIARPKPEGQ